jgi:hypothetical protein
MSEEKAKPPKRGGISYEMKQFMPPGLPCEMVTVPVFRGDQRKDLDRLNDKQLRKFVVNARLAKSADPPAGIDFSIGPQFGGSFVLAQPDALFSKIYMPNGVCVVEHNERRELANIRYECEATSSGDARGKFMRDIAPFLDHLSYVADTPLHVAQIHCEDTVNQVQAVSCIVPHRTVTLNPHAASVIAALLPIYALYREAKVSNSPFYKFLCYYKIMEGIYKHVRPETVKKAKERNIKLTMQREVVPDNEELRVTSTNLIGKPIQPLFETTFSNDFRHQVAHYIRDDGAILNVSDYAAFSEFGNKLYLMECCVRVVVAAQEGYCRATAS